MLSAPWPGAAPSKVEPARSSPQGWSAFPEYQPALRGGAQPEFSALQGMLAPDAGASGAGPAPPSPAQPQAQGVQAFAMQPGPPPPAQGMQAFAMQPGPPPPALGMQALTAMEPGPPQPAQGMQAFPAMQPGPPPPSAPTSLAWPWGSQAQAQPPAQQAPGPQAVDMSLAFGAPAQAPDTVAMLAPAALDASVMTPLAIAPPPSSNDQARFDESSKIHSFIEQMAHLGAGESPTALLQAPQYAPVPGAAPASYESAPAYSGYAPAPAFAAPAPVPAYSGYAAGAPFPGYAAPPPVLLAAPPAVTTGADAGASRWANYFSASNDRVRR